MKLANIKKPYCFLGCLAVMSIGSARAAPKPSDLPAGHWSMDAALKMIDLGVFSVFSDGTFRGTENLTRYEQSEILFNLAKAIYVQGGIDAQFIRKPNGNLFSDVAGVGSFYANWAGQNQVLLGYPDGTFRGRDALSRYDFITSIYRITQKTFHFTESTESLAVFLTDVPAGHWAVDAARWGVHQNVLLGYPDGTFRGGQAITRYEAVTAFERLYRNILKAQY